MFFKVACPEGGRILKSKSRTIASKRMRLQAFSLPSGRCVFLLTIEVFVLTVHLFDLRNHE